MVSNASTHYCPWAHLEGGGGLQGCSYPPKLKFKKHTFCRHDIKCFYVIYPSAEISHKNQVTTNKILKNKIKNLPQQIEEIEKKKNKQD
jgi:hypothetical protein